MPTSPPIPGYTETEKHLLEAMTAELYTFIAQADWAQRLPFAVGRSYVLERLGNPVQLCMKLYLRPDSNAQDEVRFRLDIRIQGTGKERWASADGGFFLGCGTAPQIAAIVASYHADIGPLQAQLFHEYRITCYNS